MATEPPSNQEPGAPANSAETLWAMLDALRRKLDDNATVGRKTQQAMVQLADSLANQVASNRKRTRWLNLNSFVAYLLFTLTIGAGFLLLYRVRTAGLVAERITAQHERDAAVARAVSAESQLQERRTADNAVWDIYALLTTGKRRAGLSALAAMPATKLSKTERAVFAELEQRTRAELVDDEYRAGLSAFRNGKFADVVTNLSAALVIENKGQRAAAMRYYLGVAQLKLNQPEAAVAALEQALAGDVELEDARYFYAAALDAQGQAGRARTEYDRFATKHPQSPWTMQASRRSAILARGPAVVAPTPNVPAAAPAPAAGSGVPMRAPAPAPARPSPAPAAPLTPAP